MDDANRAAEDLGIEIIGGHSEITADLPRSIVVVTALGRVARERALSASGARPGDALLLSKSAGLEGTAILAGDFADRLATRLPRDLLARARELIRQISVVPEALAAAGAGATAMHDATEGGVLGALAELAAASAVGVDVDLDRVPVLPETRKLADIFQIDPLALVSSGALLIATPDPTPTTRAIAHAGRPVARIGRVVAGISRVRRAGQTGALVSPDRDALWDALERGL
jgi:hydrogenase maturation factor